MQTHTIIVFGGAGRTGAEVVKQALATGHKVSAFVYRTPKPGILPEHPNLRIIQGNARDADEVQTALVGHDTVINIISPRLGDKKNYDIPIVATPNILSGMEKLGIKRYIGQCGAWGTEYLEDASILMRIGFKVVFPLRNFYAYKKKEDQQIKKSNVDWTIVRAGILTDKPLRKNVQIFMSRYKCGMFEIPKVSRANVANFELSIINDPKYYGQCPIIIN